MKGNLHQLNFAKMHKTNAANMVQSSTKDNALELWHRRLGLLNLKNGCTLQSMVSDMNLGRKKLSYIFVGL